METTRSNYRSAATMNTMNATTPTAATINTTTATSSEYPAPKPPPVSALAHLRQNDRLAEIFIYILSERRVMVLSKGRDQEAVRPLPNQLRNHLLNQYYPYLVYTDHNGRPLAPHQNPGSVCNGSSLTVDVPIPRMDTSAFRLFTQ